MNNIIITVIVAILAMAIGCAIALYLSKKNAKSQANEIIEKARLEAEVLKNNEVLKGKEKGMSIKNEAENIKKIAETKSNTIEGELKKSATFNEETYKKFITERPTWWDDDLSAQLKAQGVEITAKSPLQGSNISIWSHFLSISISLSLFLL